MEKTVKDPSGNRHSMKVQDSRPMPSCFAMEQTVEDLIGYGQSNKMQDSRPMPSCFPMERTVGHSTGNRNSMKTQDSRLIPSCFSAERTVEYPSENRPGECSVTCLHQTMIAGLCRNVTTVWRRHTMNHSLSITVENPYYDHDYRFKLDLKPWFFWNKKGFKSFDIEETRLEVFWDLQSAKLSGGPEPSGNYYVALVCEEEMVLLLGDRRKEAFKRSKSISPLIEPKILSKKEHVVGKKCFSTRAKFDQSKTENDIVVENSLFGGKNPEMWISIDGIVLIHVTNLRWKFRGNETVFVNDIPVYVFWDVHDWMFKGTTLSPALFIFKPGFPEEGGRRDDSGNDDYYQGSAGDLDQDVGGSSDGDGNGNAGDGDGGDYGNGAHGVEEGDRDGDDDGNGGGDDDNGITEIEPYSNDFDRSTRQYSIESTPTQDFCLFLYAWKME